MAIIRLNNDRECIIDDSDYEYISQYRWYYAKHGYAARTVRSGGLKKNVYMHRFIMGAKRGEVIDHKNRNTLDNRRGNLRICTVRDNASNKRIQDNNTVGFKGIYRRKENGKWQAEIKINGKKRALGCYQFKEQAAMVYDIWAIFYYGEYALTNRQLGLL